MSEPVGIVRSSALIDIFDCALRYYYKQIKKIRSVSSSPAYLGTSVHGGTTIFDAARVVGVERDDVSVDDAVGVTVDMLHHPREEVDWGGDDRRKLEATAVSLTAKYCQQIGARRRYKAVELQCKSLDVETPHGVLRLTGQTDRIHEDDQGEGISDVKTGRAAVAPDGTAKAAAHGAQLGVYTLLTEQELQRELTSDAEIIGMATTGAPRIGVVKVPRVKEMLLGTDEYPGLLDMAAQMHKSGLFPPNPKSILCSAKYCPAHSICPYHS